MDRQIPKKKYHKPGFFRITTQTGLVTKKYPSKFKKALHRAFLNLIDKQTINSTNRITFLK